jgi:hypothetical protein
MPVNGLRLLRALRRLANQRRWVLKERPGKGSHVVVVLNGAMTVIPQHRDPLKAIRSSPAPTAPF